MAGLTDSTDGPNWEQVARLETHPLRISILEVLAMDDGRTLSPSELSHELHTTTSDADYHIKALKRAGMVRLAHTLPVRGAVEHFYCPINHSAKDLFERLKPPEEAT